MLSLPNSTPTPLASDRTSRSIRRHLLALGASGALLVFGFGTLGATVRLAGAVIASGTVVVQSRVKKVSHTTGGIVSRVAVVDGSHVKAGDLLVHLDETIAAANVGALTKNWYELLVQRARLEAERDDATAITFPAALADAGNWATDVAHMRAEETGLWERRATARAGQKDQMRQRIAQLKDEIEGSERQDRAKATELAVVDRELAGIQHLYDLGLVQVTRLDALIRDSTRLRGDRGSLQAQMAQARGKIAETELQILQVDADLHSDASKQLADIRGKLSDTLEHKISAADTLKHLDILAPQDGTVQELSVHAAGAVISPTEQIMLIVPDEDKLIAEVHVAPQDIDKVYATQSTVLRFPNLNQRTTPEIAARVTSVAPDTTEDKKGGSPYYTVQLSIDRVKLGPAAELRPGMPVEALMATSERTMLSYLLKPLSDQVSRAFREK